MKIRNLAFFLLLIIPLVCYSADNIHLYSGQIIECKVLSIDTTTVTAEILNNSIKRIFYKTEIKVIIYEDGTAEVFPIVQSGPSDEMKLILDALKERSDKDEMKSAKSKGLTTGVIWCCIIVFVLWLI